MGALTMGAGLLSMMLVFATVAICGAHNAAILTVQRPSLIYKLLWASIIINGLIIAITF